MYKCFLKLAIVPSLREVVSDSGGVGWLCKEIKHHRSKSLHTVDEGGESSSSTDKLAIIFRKDLYAIRIQRMVQAFLKHKRDIRYKVKK